MFSLTRCSGTWPGPTFGEWAWWFVIGTFLEKRVAAIRKEAWDMNDNIALRVLDRVGHHADA